ncbi:hypothetical protein ARMGADRAFT_286469 [Armillaria gallica]|uniref:Uncharacterized protein n=1 Tax=Armillaria gallica TaxID=47427 RepID=A0A2H3DUE6_ARMGA|nr:hypothetical protein ARMGADRAFT_286469 [Armillaria gallica]
MTSSNPWHPRVVFLKIDVLLRAGSTLTPLTPGIGGGAKSFPAIENVSSHQLKRALGSRTSLENCVARQWNPSVWFRSVNNGMRNMVLANGQRNLVVLLYCCLLQREQALTAKALYTKPSDTISTRCSPVDWIATILFHVDTKSDGALSCHPGLTLPVPSPLHHTPS